MEVDELMKRRLVQNRRRGGVILKLLVVKSLRIVAMRFYYIFVKNQPLIFARSGELKGFEHYTYSIFPSFKSYSESPNRDTANLEMARGSPRPDPRRNQR